MKSVRRTARTEIQREKMKAVFGEFRARWLLIRERLGDTRKVRLRFAGHKHFLRLNTTDPLVWYSVFQQQDYGAPLPFEPRTIVDAGAYTGLSAIYFANRYPCSRIIAVEPDESNFRLLLKNIRDYENITPVQAALWCEDTDVSLYARAQGHWASSLIPDAERSGIACSVQGIRMETLMDRFGLQRVDLLKLDVEGAEKEILAHAAPWIDDVGALFIELHDRLIPGCSETLAAVTGNFDRTEVAPMTTLLIHRGRGAARETRIPTRPITEQS